MSSFVNAPIHDLLIRIKNSYTARNRTVDHITHSKFKEKVLDMLKTYKFIYDYEVVEQDNKKFINIKLSHISDINEAIPNIKFVSKPSRRIYVGYEDIKPVAGGKGISIISTNKGLLPGHVAKQMKVGGEYIAEVY